MMDADNLAGGCAKGNPAASPLVSACGELLFGPDVDPGQAACIAGGVDEGLEEGGFGAGVAFFARFPPGGGHDVAIADQGH